MQTIHRDHLSEVELRALNLAKDVAGNAHAPYSKFYVGAALVTEGDEVFKGCNVENASYGLTLCAERTAASAAIAAGARYFLLLAVYTSTPEPSVPCGGCRQFLAEFAPKLRLLLGCDGDDVAVTTLDELLPSPFRL